MQTLLAPIVLMSPLLTLPYPVALFPFTVVLGGGEEEEGVVGDEEGGGDEVCGCVGVGEWIVYVWTVVGSRREGIGVAGRVVEGSGGSNSAFIISSKMRRSSSSSCRSWPAQEPGGEEEEKQEDKEREEEEQEEERELKEQGSTWRS
jgi:hypothetical protein